jgi:ABC-type dipeptide/oligopeptide/nickel transport system permease component
VLDFLIRRLIATLPVLAVVLVIVFSLLRLIPGDPAVTLLGPGATDVQIEALRRELALDAPLPAQFASYLGAVLQGELGTSLKTGQPVTQEILARLPATLELSLLALVMALAIGIPMGVYSATRPDTVPDQVMRVVALAGVSLPAFLLALLLQLTFAVWLGLLPVSGRLDADIAFAPITGLLVLDGLVAGRLDVVASALAHLILPATVLAAFLATVLSRFVRNAMLDVLSEDYVRAARAKGMASRTVVWDHALRNALIPAITVTGLAFADMLGGAILTETIFAWPGVGRMMFEAIRDRDYPVIQGLTLLFSLFYLAISLLVDIVAAALDPRLRSRMR